MAVHHRNSSSKLPSFLFHNPYFHFFMTQLQFKEKKGES